MIFKSAILTTEYLPPISSFWGMKNSENVLLEVNENYQKKSSRNRSKILGVNGVEVLSVPLKKGKNNKMPIIEVAISYENTWQGKHLHSIKSAYGNSPYFDYYFDSIKSIINTKNESLINLNQDLLTFFLSSLDMDVEINHTKEYIKAYDNDCCDLRPLKFNQLELEGFSPKMYNQVFEEKHGFVPGLSILDLLMCKGPESILYI